MLFKLLLYLYILSYIIYNLVSEIVKIVIYYIKFDIQTLTNTDANYKNI